MTAGVVGLNAFLLDRWADDPPDPAYEQIPEVISAVNARLPRVGATQGVTPQLARRLDRYVRHHIRAAALSLAILQGIERANAAYRAQEPQIEERPAPCHAQAGSAPRQAILLEASSSATSSRPRGASPTPKVKRRISKQLRRQLRRQLASAGRRLVRIGFPRDAISGALDELAQDDRRAPRGRLERTIRAPWLHAREH